MSSATASLMKQTWARQGKRQARCLLRSGTKRTIAATTTATTKLKQNHTIGGIRNITYDGSILRVVQPRSGGVRRCLSAEVSDLRCYYHIEASNAARPGATALIVSGPDVDGMLASMTVALAMGGCSLLELHAAKSDFCDRVSAESTGVRDIFYVVNKETGEPFSDDDLEVLAVALLESLRSPMTTLGRKDAWKETVEGAKPYDSVEEQITIVPSP
jgi:hypothetical protein